MNFVKTSVLLGRLLISLLSQATPSKATVLDLRALNDEAAELASKIRQHRAARDNAQAAGETKLACDFQSSSYA